MPKDLHVPSGYLFAGMHAGIKIRKNDLAILLSEHTASAAGVVTQNRTRAACTDRTADLLPADNIRAVVIVSGNANALTGPSGVEDDLSLADSTAAALGLETKEVVTCCTGVVGVPMPIEVVKAGVKQVGDHLSKDPIEFANAILTTDTSQKTSSRSVIVDGRPVKLLGIAKGSGMIHPNMATMLAFISTDLNASSDQLQRALTTCVSRSFNRISVDRDVSTNDTVILMANGAAKVGNRDDDALPESFLEALQEICTELAIAIARDGEGATRLLSVTIEGASSEENAAQLARAVTESSLFKSALFSGDPNWGRAMAAIGARAADLKMDDDPKLGRLQLQGITVFDQAPCTDIDASRLRHLMQSADIRVQLTLDEGGPGTATAWGCDLSYEYVRINADIAATITESASGTIARVNEIKRLSPRMRHELLVDCLDHIQRFQELITVVRVAGDAATREDLREALVRDLLLLRSAGLRPILVHGGGLDVARSMKRAGQTLKLEGGVPSSSGEATKVLEATLVGRVNKDLVSLVHRLNGRAVGLSGKDGDLIRARRTEEKNQKPDGNAAGVVEQINAEIISVLDKADYLPVIAPIGIGPDGETVTLSADQVAAHLAGALNAGKLIFIGDGPGLMEKDNLLTQLRGREARKLLRGDSLDERNRQKIEAALTALSKGVPRVHFVDGRVPHSIIGELFTTSGVGTMIRPD